MQIRHITPTLRIGQRTTRTREIQLVEADGSTPVDLSDANSVTLTLEHYELGFTAVQGGECTIVSPTEGIVEYTFTQQDTSLHGRYSLQFEVDYGDENELVLPNSDEWVIDIGRRQPKYQPLDVPSIAADEGVFGTLQADRASLATLSGLGEPSGEFVTDLYGKNLYFENGRLNAFDPAGTGEVFDHYHTATNGDGGAIGAAGDPAAPAFLEEVTVGGEAIPDAADLPIAAFTYAGVTWWIGTEETPEMAETDVFIDIS